MRVETSVTAVGGKYGPIHHAEYYWVINGVVSSEVCRVGGLEVECLPHEPRVLGSISAGVDRFSACDNRRHAYHMFFWHVENPFSINLALVILEKLHPTRA
ncbi:hypothetical protein TNCV_2540201 [Trichonephila clavipes]|nr:hypothetical protein TNCV_2540201 [Trichonephila clavipes]